MCRSKVARERLRRRSAPWFLALTSSGVLSRMSRGLEEHLVELGLGVGRRRVDLGFMTPPCGFQFRRLALVDLPLDGVDVAALQGFTPLAASNISPRSFLLRHRRPADADLVPTRQFTSGGDRRSSSAALARTCAAWQRQGCVPRGVGRRDAVEHRAAGW